MNDKITEIIAKHLGHKHRQVTPEQTLVENLGADSLDIIEICMAIEDEYGISITDEQCDAWETVRDVIDCVNRLVQ